MGTPRVPSETARPISITGSETRTGCELGSEGEVSRGMNVEAIVGTPVPSSIRCTVASSMRARGMVTSSGTSPAISVSSRRHVANSPWIPRASMTTRPSGSMIRADSISAPSRWMCVMGPTSMRPRNTVASPALTPRCATRLATSVSR
jgi:hypothetical protein